MLARRLLVAALMATALVGGLTACSSDHGTSDSIAAQLTGRDADIAFAQMMIPHHQQAVEMSDIALSKGAGPEVTELATEIKGAQDPEIAQMRSWLSTWGASEAMDHGSDHSGMPGMMSDDQMQQLRGSSGEQFDRMWMEMMIAHHEGAITMAKDVLATTVDPDVTKLAEAVVAGQTAEIAQMRELLAG